MQLGSQPWKFCTTQASCLTHVKNMQFRHIFSAVMMYSSGKYTLVLWTVSSLPSFFPYFPFSFPLNMSNFRVWNQGVSTRFSRHARTLTHTHPHHSTTHLSASGIIPVHLTRPKRACWVLEQAHTHSLFPENHHSLNPSRITGRRCASFTSCTPVGNPPPAPANTSGNILLWPQGANFN